MKRLVVGIAVLAVLGLVGFFGWRYHVAHRVVPPRFTTVAVGRRNIIGKVTATGTLAATVTVTVGTQVSGRIDKLFADFNSPVKKGQLVAKIDPLLFQAAVQQSQANFLQAQAAVEQAKANKAQADRQYARELALLKGNLAAQQDVDTAQTAAAVAKAGVDSSQASLAQATASLNQAKVNLSYTDIISPIDGVVISRAVDVGQTVASSLSAPTLFTIAQDLRKMQVNTNVAEGDVGRLEQGMPVTFTVDAYPGEKFKGQLSQIRNAATTVSNVVTYDALIDVDNNDLKLRPGMTANATIISAEQDNVLAIPNAALRFRPADGTVSSASPNGSGSGRHRGKNAPAGDSAAPANSGDPNGGGGGGGGGGHQHGDGGISPDGGLAAKIAAAAGDAGVDFSTKAVIEAASHKTIYVVVDNVATPVQVVVGLTDGSYTEIIAGKLNEGDLIATDSTESGSPAPTTTKPTASPLTGGGGHGGGGRGP
ncbi:MAG: efflux RND transporter periplasmic adaptor subunit [Polyangiaceae bacterium]